MRLRPATRDDFVHAFGDLPPFRTQCLVMEHEGRLVAIGGLVYRPDGIWATVHLTSEVRQHPIALHRAVVKGLKSAAARGVRNIFAQAQAGNDAAEPWLKRLGFRQVDPATRLWVWQHKEMQ